MDPADQFVKSVEEGMRLSKRLYMGKENSSSIVTTTTPPESVKMGKQQQQSSSYLPTAPMIYAVISDPSVVDNPDIPSYQPHVHGRCDPPALIPLHMNEIKMEIDSFLDTAFVSITGSWRVHCVMRSRRCLCRLAVPMGEQGSVLGVEVVATGKSYSTQLIAMEEEMDTEKVAKSESGGFLKPQLFTLTIPKVEGGSMLSVKVTWSQKLLFSSGQFSLSIPFNFPESVTPPGTGTCKREKIMLSACSGTGTEVLFMSTSHPLKHTTQQVGKLAGSYEAEVIMWSNTDFNFSYAVSSSDILGGLFLHSPFVQDFDQREMFCLYLLPGTDQIRKVFRKEVIFLIDLSGSMQGWPLGSVKTALSSALSNLNAEDSFSIIAFNGETCVFSSTLELATKKTIAKAAQWMSTNFTAGGSTNILSPLNQAMEMLSDARDSIPLIFLITDGAVDDERRICDLVRSQRKHKGSQFPRITTFGIGAYCNHYFLRMLALIGGGHYDAAYCPDSVDTRIQRLFTTASSVVLANITIDNLDHLDAIEVYPSHIPDLSSGSPLIVSGRYQGKFPDCLKVRGIMEDRSNFTVSFKVQKAKEIPLDKVVAKQQIDLLTAEAWFAESKQLEEKVMKLSIQSGISSEYTRMILVQSEGGKQACKSVKTHEVLNKINLQKLLDSKGNKIILVRSLGIGFGNTTATVENLPPRFGGPILPDAEASILVKAASGCCSALTDRICCMCCIQTCNHINDQLAVVVTQLCAALSCLACLSCCAELCFD